MELRVVTKPAGSKRVQRRHVEVNVAGIEQVTTPAGTFKAYKLIGSESWLAMAAPGGQYDNHLLL